MLFCCLIETCIAGTAKPLLEIIENARNVKNEYWHISPETLLHHKELNYSDNIAAGA